MMNTYILTLFLAAVIFSLIQYLADSFPQFRSYVVFLIGLCTVLMTVSPLVSFLNSFSYEGLPPLPVQDDQNYEGGEKELALLAEKRLEARIVSEIQSTYQNEVTSVKISLWYDEDQSIFFIKSLKVVLKRETNKQEIARYLKETYSENVSVESEGSKS